MAASSAKSVIIVGGGIVGLTIAVVAQARGHNVTLIARDKAEDTASGVAAGMIAPVLEARPDYNNDQAWHGLRNAQQAWIELLDIWPPVLQKALRQQGGAARSTYVWPGDMSEDDEIFFAIRHVDTVDLSREDLNQLGVRKDLSGLWFTEDWLVDATAVLSALEMQFDATGGKRLDSEVYSVSAHKARLGDGTELLGDYVIVAAGYDSKAFGGNVACLDLLLPIKGHLLDIAPQGPPGITRYEHGYVANYGAAAKYGATMQFGQEDLIVEPDVVVQLKSQALDIFPNLMGLDQAVSRVGIRAASPDGWPMIGRDQASGVLVATAMRRNGYVFAPLAARMMLAFLASETPPEAALYDPNRFS